MISEKLKDQLGDWTCLYEFFESDEWIKIKQAIKPDFSNTTPEIDNWFRAFKLCPYEKVSTVFLGLSPYYTKDEYTKKNVADGLAFSTDSKHSVPPSLFKIYKGMEWDMWKGVNRDMRRSNNLEFLAEQGVLLLNSALTTTYGRADTHLEVWKPFIKFVIKVLNEKKKDLIFVGFGKHANTLLTSVDKSIHSVEEREHPAASAYAYRDWKHNNIFSEINEKLSNQHKPPILWDKYLVELEVPF